MAAVPMLRINVELGNPGTAIFGDLACQLHITDNFTLGAWQKAVRRRRSQEAAAIEIALQWKDDALGEGVVASGSHQTGLTQSHQRVAQLCQPTSQATTGRVTDLHVLEQFR
jgi:hypothetical protein